MKLLEKRESMRGDICAILSIIKIHWESKETYHFFRATVATIHLIRIIHIWIQMSYTCSSPYEALKKKRRVVCVKKEKIALKSQQVIKKTHTQKLLTERAPCYILTFNRYSFSLNDGFICNCLLSVAYARPCSFWDSWKLISCNFTAFFSFPTRANLCFFSSDVLNNRVLKLICVQM